MKTHGEHISSSSIPLAVNSAASALARLVTVGALLFTLSLSARNMTAEEFGLWSILLSFMFLFMGFDLGFRYGMGNRVAALVAAGGEDVRSKTRAAFQAVFCSQVVIALSGSVVCLAVLSHLPWAEFFSISQVDLAIPAPRIIGIVGALLFAYLPFSVASVAFYALQEIKLASCLSAVQALVLVVVFTLAQTVCSFFQLAIIYFATYVLCGVAITIVFFFKHRSFLGWVPWLAQRRILRSIAPPSLNFFLLNLSSSLTAAGGTLFSGAVAGLQEAGHFALLQKLFGLLVTLYLALLAPLAPAYTGHARLNQWNWVRRKLRFSVRWSWPLLFVVGGGILCAVHPLIIRVWIGKWLVDYQLAGLLALGALMTGWISNHSVLLNSLGLVRAQALFSLVMAMPIVALPLILGRFWGVYGVATSAAICALPGALVWPIYTARALDRKWLNV